jgi:hypothetical protein
MVPFSPPNTEGPSHEKYGYFGRDLDRGGRWRAVFRPFQLYRHQESHTVWIPTAAGIVIVLAGVGLLMAGRKS